MEADNFAGQARDWILDRDRLVARPRRLRPGRWARSTATSCSPTTTPPTHALGAGRAVPPADPAGRSRPTGPLREMARLVRLQWASDQDVIALRQALLEERARAVIAEEYARGPGGGAGAAADADAVAGRLTRAGTPLAGAVSGARSPPTARPGCCSGARRRAARRRRPRRPRRSSTPGVVDRARAAGLQDGAVIGKQPAGRAPTAHAGRCSGRRPRPCWSAGAAVGCQRRHRGRRTARPGRGRRRPLADPRARSCSRPARWSAPARAIGPRLPDRRAARRLMPGALIGARHGDRGGRVLRPAA